MNLSRPLLLFGLALSPLSAFALTSADTLYLGNATISGIATVDASGHVSPFVSTGFYPPSALAFDRNGVLYAAMQNNLIYRYDSQGNATLFASSGLNIVTALAFDSNNHLFAANGGDRTIVQFDDQGNSSVFANTGMIQPYGGLAFDNHGNLYVALEGSYTVNRYDPQGNGWLFASVEAPYAMAFRAGYLYVATGLDEIYRLDSLGNSTLFADSGLSAPSGMGFDSTGALIVANYSGTIVKFDSFGNPTLIANAGFTANCLAIQPVPEPSALQLFGLGFVALTIFWRPRRS